VVQFGLEAVVRLEIEAAAEQQVESGIKVLLGGFEVPCLIVFLPGFVFLLDAGDQVADRIDREGLRRLRLGLRVGAGGGCGRLLLGIIGSRVGDQGWSLRVGRRQEGLLLRALAGKSRRQAAAEQDRRIASGRKPHSFKYIPHPPLGAESGFWRPSPHD